MTFLLCADLHLKETEKEYSMSVLNEIINICKEKKCEALLFAGDVFDDWGEAKLRIDFRKALENLPPDCKVYYLPGNHEELRSSSSDKLENFDFGGRVCLLNEKPFSFLHDFCPEAELLAVPFQKDYSDYRKWQVPEKNKNKRILLAHGIVTGTGVYTGPLDIKDGVFDDDLFSFFKIDLVAIGHIHSGRIDTKDNRVIVYPGSARVCRKGETGPRKIIIADTYKGISEFPLASAGEYKAVQVFALPNGEFYPNLQGIEMQPNDSIDLIVSGFVEDENKIKTILEDFKTNCINNKKCREITDNRDKLTVVSGIATHRLVKNFLEIWEEEKSKYQDDTDLYNEVLFQGLLVLQERLGKKK